jgi:hypothetical protein
MNLREAETWLARAMRDPWYKHEMPITVSTLGNLVDSQMPLRDDRYDATLKRLAMLIPQVEERKLVLIDGKFLTIDPPEKTIVKRMNRGWHIGARCTCGSNKFLPVMMEKEYAVCYVCLPPDQYPSFGGALLSKRLIETAARILYLVDEPQ